MKLLFSLFDSNHDGRISQDEIKQLVETVSGQSWSEEQLDAFMKVVDTDSKESQQILYSGLNRFLSYSEWGYNHGRVYCHDESICANKYTWLKRFI